MNDYTVHGETGEGEAVTVDVRARSHTHARILGLARLRALYGRDTRVTSIDELGMADAPMQGKRASYQREARRRQAEHRENPSGETDY